MACYFNNGHVFLDIEVYGVFTQSKKQFSAQIDTGYSGCLTLQYTDAFPLGLVLIGTKAYTIADGSTMYSFLGLGTVIIDGKAEIIPIDIQPKGSILLGVDLLKKFNSELKIDFVNQTAILTNKPPSPSSQISPTITISKKTK